MGYEFFNRIYRHVDFSIVTEEPVTSTREINGIILMAAYDVSVNVANGDFWKEKYITKMIPFNVNWLYD